MMFDERKEGRKKGRSIDVKLGTGAFNVFVGNTKAVHCFLHITVLDVNKPEQTSSRADSFITR